jgi:hypothetical protein
MKRAGKAAAGAAKPQRVRARVVAAYREGLGLVGIAIVCGAVGARVIVVGPGDAKPDADADVKFRWWCLHAADAQRIASAATRQTRRLESRAGDTSSTLGSAGDVSLALSQARDAVLVAARRLNILLQSDIEIADEAAVVAARIDAEVERMRLRGELKSVNQAYRKYRIEATARGERVMSYAEWMRKRKEKWVREAASTLRRG